MPTVGMLWQNWLYWFFLAVKCLCTEIQVLELFSHLFPPSPPQSLHKPSAKGRRRGLPSSEIWPTLASFETGLQGLEHQGQASALLEREKPTHWKFHSSAFTDCQPSHPVVFRRWASCWAEVPDLLRTSTPGRAGHAPADPSPAWRRRGPLPWLRASFPGAGPGSRRAGTGREAAAAAPWLCRNAGSCRLGQHLQFSYQRHKSSTAIGQAPAPAPIPALESSPLQPEPAAWEGNELGWWSHWAENLRQVWWTWRPPPGGAGGSPHGWKGRGLPAPTGRCRSESASVWLRSVFRPSRALQRPGWEERLFAILWLGVKSELRQSYCPRGAGMAQGEAV